MSIGNALPSSAAVAQMPTCPQLALLDSLDESNCEGDSFVCGSRRLPQTAYAIGQAPLAPATPATAVQACARSGWQNPMQVFDGQAWVALLIRQGQRLNHVWQPMAIVLPGWISLHPLQTALGPFCRGLRQLQIDPLVGALWGSQSWLGALGSLFVHDNLSLFCGYIEGQQHTAIGSDLGADGAGQRRIFLQEEAGRATNAQRGLALWGRLQGNLRQEERFKTGAELNARRSSAAVGALLGGEGHQNWSTWGSLRAPTPPPGGQVPLMPRLRGPRAAGLAGRPATAEGPLAEGEHLRIYCSRSKWRQRALGLVALHSGLLEAEQTQCVLEASGRPGGLLDVRLSLRAHAADMQFVSLPLAPLAERCPKLSHHVQTWTYPGLPQSELAPLAALLEATQDRPALAWQSTRVRLADRPHSSLTHTCLQGRSWALGLFGGMAPQPLVERFLAPGFCWDLARGGRRGIWLSQTDKGAQHISALLQTGHSGHRLSQERRLLLATAWQPEPTDGLPKQLLLRQTENSGRCTAYSLHGRLAALNGSLGTAFSIGEAPGEAQIDFSLTWALDLQALRARLQAGAVSAPLVLALLAAARDASGQGLLAFLDRHRQAGVHQIWQASGAPLAALHVHLSCSQLAVPGSLMPALSRLHLAPAAERVQPPEAARALRTATAWAEALAPMIGAERLQHFKHQADAAQALLDGLPISAPALRARAAQDLSWWQRLWRRTAGAAAQG